MVGGQKPHARPAMCGQWAHGSNRQFFSPPFRSGIPPALKLCLKLVSLHPVQLPSVGQADEEGNPLQGASLDASGGIRPSRREWSKGAAIETSV